MKTTESQAYYSSRFCRVSSRDAAWKSICRHLQRYIAPTARVLDVGAGYCSFINNIDAGERTALDINPDVVRFAEPGVATHVGHCADLSFICDHHMDVIFCSNVLEHLPREDIRHTLAEFRRVLAPTGRIVLLQPNFRYSYRQYFDDYTHVSIFTHVSLGDLLSASGFTVEHVIARFLPFSFKTRWPVWAWLVSLYLHLPWRPNAKQMLVVARPSACAACTLKGTDAPNTQGL